VNIHSIVIVLERAGMGVKPSVLDNLKCTTNPPSIPVFFVHYVASSMAIRLGDFQGHAFPEPLSEEFPDENIIKEVWGRRLDTHLASARVDSDHPSGFFGVLLRGVFGMKRPVAGDVLALRKRLVTCFLDNWSQTKFRTIVWELPEMNKYRSGRVKFLLDILVQDWLGQNAGCQPSISRLAIDLCARAFDIQIGVVRVDSQRNLGLTVYGDFTRQRVYVACNGLERHHQRFYFFTKGS